MHEHIATAMRSQGPAAVVVAADAEDILGSLQRDFVRGKWSKVKERIWSGFKCKTASDFEAFGTICHALALWVEHAEHKRLTQVARVLEAKPGLVKALQYALVDLTPSPYLYYHTRTDADAKRKRSAVITCEGVSYWTTVDKWSSLREAVRIPMPKRGVIFSNQGLPNIGAHIPEALRLLCVDMDPDPITCTTLHRLAVLLELREKMVHEHEVLVFGPKTFNCEVV